MKKLHIIATGGTIACVPSPNGLMPGLGAKELLEYVPGGHKIEYTDLFHMDSSNIQPEEWQQMAKAVIKARESCSGIVITHGTDTMAYTASMLSFMLRDIDIPVVLTGSQYPIVRPDSDGRKNLHNAIIAASELTGGVYIAFGDAVIKGCRAVKTRTTSLNAFESINYPYIGAVANGGFISFVRPEGGILLLYRYRSSGSAHKTHTRHQPGLPRKRSQLRNKGRSCGGLRPGRGA